MYEDDDNEPDLDRYDTAAGYQPPDPYAKQREEARKALAAQSSDSMLETRPAGEWIARRGDRKELPSELYRSFWNEGELAILFGGKGSGKSVLAVQIAQSIALSASKVLYLDFQRTKRQWTERYTAPSLVPGKLPVRHRFPPRNFIRAGLDWDGTIPDDFKNDADHFMRHSVLDKLENTGARILIVDDILWLGRNTARVMKTLKFWATAYDLSILVLAPMKP
ncbi:MAG TPA: AAA family ATPase, partial [Pyrinomonadaceae bacterium]|nr:AAA family ATPase [Pyrinomonadaceae bacterium]